MIRHTPFSSSVYSRIGGSSPCSRACRVIPAIKSAACGIPDPLPPDGPGQESDVLKVHHDAQSPFAVPHSRSQRPTCQDLGRAGTAAALTMDWSCRRSSPDGHPGKCPNTARTLPGRPDGVFRMDRNHSSFSFQLKKWFHRQKSPLPSAGAGFLIFDVNLGSATHPRPRKSNKSSKPGTDWCPQPPRSRQR